MTGYWAMGSDGKVYPFGEPFPTKFGESASANLAMVDIEAAPHGTGYWVFTQGDASFEGSTGAIKLNQPVQSIVPDPDGTGCWLVASDGGVFSFKALFRGSTGDIS